MGRLIAYIIIAIISIFLRSAGYSGRRYRYRYGYGYGYGRTMDDIGEDIVTSFTTFIRRQIALRKAKPYVTKYRDSYSLKNQNVSILFKHKTGEMSCLNLRNRNQNFKFDWSDYKDNMFSTISNNMLMNSLNETFNQLCMHFNYQSNYDGTLTYLQEYYTIKPQEKQPVSEPIPVKPKQKQPVYVDEYFEGDNALGRVIDLNTAKMEDLANLPGINIIMAKKIVTRRNEKGGFTSLDEFYEEFKIKPHFQKQLNGLLMIFEGNDILKDRKSEYDYLKPKPTDDRIIDI